MSSIIVLECFGVEPWCVPTYTIHYPKTASGRQATADGGGSGSVHHSADFENHVLEFLGLGCREVHGSPLAYRLERLKHSRPFVRQVHRDRPGGQDDTKRIQVALSAPVINQSVDSLQDRHRTPARTCPTTVPDHGPVRPTSPRPSPAGYAASLERRRDP